MNDVEILLNLIETSGLSRVNSEGEKLNQVLEFPRNWITRNVYISKSYFTWGEVNTLVQTDQHK